MCFPKIDTRVTNEWLGERLEFRIQTFVAEGKAELDNAVKLEYFFSEKWNHLVLEVLRAWTHSSTPSAEQLKLRKVQNIDIVEYKSKEMDPNFHPTKVQLKKIKPSPLTPGWMDVVKTATTAYKVVSAKVQGSSTSSR